MASRFASVLVFLCVINCGLLKKIPDYIQVCKREPNTIEDCAKKSVEGLRDQMVAGIPELNVPSIDPFFIAEIKPPADFPINATVYNIKVTGAAGFILKGLSVDLDTFKFRVQLRFPKLHLEGEYKVNGQLLVVPLNGEGTMVADAVKCDADLMADTEIYKRDGEDYLKFKNFISNISIKDYKIRVTGLGNGDPVIEEATNQALNQNRGEFLKITKPQLERAVSRIITKAANNIVEDIPLKDLVPLP